MSDPFAAAQRLAMFASIAAPRSTPVQMAQSPMMGRLHSDA
jgi:hypothetical protein